MSNKFRYFNNSLMFVGGVAVLAYSGLKLVKMYKKNSSNDILSRIVSVAEAAAREGKVCSSIGRFVLSHSFCSWEDHEG